MKERAGTVCQVLAKEAIFGKEVMARCTPGKDLPGLPCFKHTHFQATSTVLEKA